MKTKTTPVALGYRMPAEWEPHSATWLSWPHNSNTWPGQNMAHVEAVYIDIIRALHTGETVNLLVNSAEISDSVASRLSQAGVSLDAVRIHVIPTNDAWIRDYGPNFIVRPGVDKPIAFNKWHFNSWGGKYKWDKDEQVGLTIADRLDMPVFHLDIILEGGAIECNGQGVCITTEQCLFNKNRNPNLGREDMEHYLKDYLGVRKVIWCQGEIEGDDTDGHIDNLMRFVSPNTILTAWEDDPQDPNHKCLKENLETLKAATDQDGKAFNVVRLPMPGYVLGNKSRLPASYANFYIGNQVVLLPVYGHPNDETARSIVQKHFPTRKVVCIPSQTFIWGLGGIHCVTQQQPACPD
jgi:agmatine deiminase